MYFGIINNWNFTISAIFSKEQKHDLRHYKAIFFYFKKIEFQKIFCINFFCKFEIFQICIQCFVSTFFEKYAD